MKQNLTLTRNGSNRFCIVLQSETPIDDGTWLKFLLLLNAVIPKIDGRLVPILEEAERPKADPVVTSIITPKKKKSCAPSS